MTEQTWNEEQIEAAVRQVLTAPEAQQVMDKLTKPKWKPEDGEAVAHKSIGSLHYWGRVTQAHLYRPLTPSEVPALKVAIEALEGTETLIAFDALAKIKELTDG